MTQAVETLSFTHLDADGKLRMVDVGEKNMTQRVAIAESRVRISPQLEAAILDGAVPKGNLLECARLAGIQAAKRTDELIPLCHSLPLDSVAVDLHCRGGYVHIRATAKSTWKTGVEMEALVAASVAALTVIDMGKAVDRSMVIEEVKLVHKSGGRHGIWNGSEAEAGDRESA